MGLVRAIAPIFIPMKIEKKKKNLSNHDADQLLHVSGRCFI